MNEASAVYLFTPLHDNVVVFIARDAFGLHLGHELFDQPLGFAHRRAQTRLGRHHQLVARRRRRVVAAEALPGCSFVAAHPPGPRRDQRFQHAHARVFPLLNLAVLGEVGELVDDTARVPRLLPQQRRRAPENAAFGRLFGRSFGRSALGARTGVAALAAGLRTVRRRWRVVPTSAALGAGRSTITMPSVSRGNRPRRSICNAWQTQKLPQLGYIKKGSGASQDGPPAEQPQRNRPPRCARNGSSFKKQWSKTCGLP